MPESPKNIEPVVFPEDVVEKLEVIVERLDFFNGSSDLEYSEELLANAFREFDTSDPGESVNTNSKTYREIRNLFKDSLIVRARSEIDLRKAEGRRIDNQLVKEVAKILAMEVDRAGNVPPYKSALKMVSDLLYRDDIYLTEKESLELRTLLEEVDSGEVTSKSALKLRRVKKAAKGISMNTEAIRSTREILKYYGVEDMSNTIRELANMYRVERMYKIKVATNSGGIGSAEAFDVEVDNAGGVVGGPSQARRPRRYGDGLGRN